MNILYLCTYYHRAMLFRDSMNFLEGKGETVRAFNAVAYGTKVDEKYKSIMDDKVCHQECFSRKDRLVYFLKQWKIYRSVLNNVDVKQYDLIHSHTLMNGGWVARNIKRKYKIPYVVTARNTDLNDYLRIPLFIPIARLILNEASKIMFLSDTYRIAILKRCYGSNTKKISLMKEKTKVIPNGLEPFWLSNKSEAKRNCHDVIRLLCVGKIDSNKNMRMIVEAMKELSYRGIQSNLTIVGQVVDNEVLCDLQRSQDVILVDFLTKEELINYYRNSDIYVMPSITESFGRVYAEAMTQGVPVIYTSGQGFDGIFPEGEVGFSVDPHSPKDIADKIVRIRDNYSAISKGCVDNCGLFDWSEIADELIDMYHDAMEG